MREKCMSNITVTTLFCSIYVLRYSRMSSVREKKNIQFLKLILYTHALDFKFLKKCEYFRIFFTFFFSKQIKVYFTQGIIFSKTTTKDKLHNIINFLYNYLGNLFMAKKIQFFGVFICMFVTSKTKQKSIFQRVF